MCLLAYGLWRLRDRVRPGVVFALYLLGSGLERFLVEFVRRNSEVLAGLTAPQLESLGLLRDRAARGSALLVRRGGTGRAPPERHGRSDGSMPAGDNHLRWPPARLSHAFPLGSRLNERGRLEVGGCDTIELAARVRHARLRRRRGRPARPRARLPGGRARRRSRRLPRRVRLQGVSLHRRARAVRAGGAVVRRGLRRRAAPGAGAPASRPSGSCCTATPSPRPSCAMALAPRRRADRDRQLRRDRAARAPDRRRARSPARGSQAVLMRVTPDVRGETHEKISTGQADSKFGFAMADAAEAIERVRAVAGPRAAGPARAHRLPAAGPRALPARRRGARARSATSRSGTSAAASACGYTEEQPRRPRSRTTWQRSSSAAQANGHGPRAAPADRARPRAVRQRGRDALHGRERQAERLALGGRRRRHVRQPAPDALRRALRGARGRPLRRLDRVRARGQALRVRRRDRARRARSTTRARAT